MKLWVYIFDEASMTYEVDVAWSLDEALDAARVAREFNGASLVVIRVPEKNAVPPVKPVPVRVKVE